MSSTYLETIKSQDGKLFNMSYHQARYEYVLNSLGVEKIQNLSDFLDPPKKGLYKCRLVYSKDTVEVSYSEYIKRDVSSLRVVYDDDIEYLFKSTDRKKLDRLFSLRDGCDDVLVVKNSFITDTSIANIAFLVSDVWITPREPLLKGTTRARLLDEGMIFKSDISVDDLKSVSKVALLNSMIEFDILDNCEFLI